MNQRQAPNFAGLRPPSVPFTEVRDRRRAFPLYYDLDLTVARSIAAGTPAVLPLAGNFFFIDQDPTNVGNATVRFVDNNSVWDTPIAVGPGSNWRVPFTGLVIENAAQAGKRLRILYGVDIETVPGINAQVVIAGAVSVIGPHAMNVGPVLTDSPVLTREVGILFGSNFQSAANLAAGATEQIFSAAANANGAVIWEAEIDSLPSLAGTGTIVSLHTHTAAPAAFTDGQAHLQVIVNLATAVGQDAAGRQLARARFIPAGRGAWFYNNGGGAEGAGRRRCLYTLF